MKNRELLRQDLAKSVRECRKCPGLNIPMETEAAPGYGDLNSPVMLVGQSLCKPCMASQVPFTRGSGRLIDMALVMAQTNKKELFTTNVVHCHPPQNRPSLEHEKINCRPFLEQECRLVKPILIICLGKDAKEAITSIVNNIKVWSEGAPLPTPGSEALVYFVHHPSYILRQAVSIRDSYVLDLSKSIAWAFNRQLLKSGGLL